MIWTSTEDDNDGMLDIYEGEHTQTKGRGTDPLEEVSSGLSPISKAFSSIVSKLYLDIHDIVHGSHNDPPFDKDSVRCLKQYIRYMDNVMMEAWEQCRVAAIAQELSPDWRCPALDRWLSLEFHVKRHDVRDVQLYKVKNSGSGLNEDPFELGMLDVYSHVPLFYFICILCHRIGLNTRHPFPTGITEGGYDYQIMEISDEDLRGIITKVMRWLEYLPDTSDDDDEDDERKMLATRGKTVTVQEEETLATRRRIQRQTKEEGNSQGQRVNCFLPIYSRWVDHVEISLKKATSKG